RSHEGLRLAALGVIRIAKRALRTRPVAVQAGPVPRQGMPWPPAATTLHARTLPKFPILGIEFQQTRRAAVGHQVPGSLHTNVSQSDMPAKPARNFGRGRG